MKLSDLEAAVALQRELKPLGISVWIVAGG
jgi:hypothetical protein